MNFYLSTPFLFSLELTPACNNRCPGCGNVFARQPAGLSAGQWAHILQLIQPHARTLKITGGEPTLHPDFSAILAHVERLGIPFTLFTNARWTNPGQIVELLAGLKHLGGLLISLHGSDAAAHESFTGASGSFEQTCANIRYAVEAGLRVHTSTVLTPYNMAQLNEVAGLARSLGAKRAVFNRFLGPADSPFQPTEAQLRQAIHTIETLRRTDGFPDAFSVRYGNCVPQCLIPSGSSGCWAGVAYCTIDPWGNLRPCNHSPTVVGNLFKHSLETLWQSATMQAWRTLTPKACYTCGAYEQCHGGCHAISEIDPAGCDPLIRAPLAQYPDVVVDLYQHGKPGLNCEILPAKPGLALVRGLSIFIVSEAARPILEEIKSQTTLADLQAVYGQEGLDFVGGLIRRGFARLI